MNININVEQDGGENIYVLFDNENQIGAISFYNRDEIEVEMELFINFEYGKYFDKINDINIYYDLFKRVIDISNIFAKFNGELRYTIVLSFGEDFKNIEKRKILPLDRNTLFEVC